MPTLRTCVHRSMHPCAQSDIPHPFPSRANMGAGHDVRPACESGSPRHATWQPPVSEGDWRLADSFFSLKNDEESE